MPQRADYHLKSTAACTPDGAGLTPRKKTSRCPCALPPSPTTWAGRSPPADVLPRHLMHEQRGLAPLKALCERLRAPVECRELALLMCAEHPGAPRPRTARRHRAETVQTRRRPCAALRALPNCWPPAAPTPVGRLGFADSPHKPTTWPPAYSRAKRGRQRHRPPMQQSGGYCQAVDAAQEAAVAGRKHDWGNERAPRAISAAHNTQHSDPGQAHDRRQRQ